MESKTWFILSNDKINGPFESAKIQMELSQGNWMDCRFWKKGLSGWLTPALFHEEIINNKKQNETHKSINDSWLIKENNQELGPISYSELLSFLKNKSNYKNVFVSNTTEKLWREVYQIESIMDKLGVNRRAHPRVPIEGKVLVLDGFLKGKTAPLTTLSQGGLGTTELKGFSIGEKIKGVFSAVHFSSPIHFQGEIVFIKQNGGFGLKFTNISTESLSLIIAYVKQFVELHPETDYKKIA